MISIAPDSHLAPGIRTTSKPLPPVQVRWSRGGTVLLPLPTLTLVAKPD